MLKFTSFKFLLSFFCFVVFMFYVKWKISVLCFRYFLDTNSKKVLGHCSFCFFSFFYFLEFKAVRNQGVNLELWKVLFRWFKSVGLGIQNMDSVSEILRQGPWRGPQNVYVFRDIAFKDIYQITFTLEFWIAALLYTV